MKNAQTLIAACGAAAVVAGLIAVGGAGGKQESKINETFENYAKTITNEDGQTTRGWRTVFDGQKNGPGVWLNNEGMRLAPQVASAPEETHSSLVVATKEIASENLNLEAQYVTRKQLRENNPANPWEVAWLIWNYQDNDNFTYLILKPNGWEIGRRHPDGDGGQQFIATGETPTTSIGQARTATIRQRGQVCTILVDGKKIATVTLREEEIGGKIGIYTEDAEILLTKISARNPASK